MTELEELGLDNCGMSGSELIQLGQALNKASFLKKLKRLHLVKNDFDSVESCQAVADAIAKCPHFEECFTQKSGVRITVNHRVKVRRTQIFITKDPDT